MYIWICTEYSLESDGIEFTLHNPRNSLSSWLQSRHKAELLYNYNEHECVSEVAEHFYIGAYKMTAHNYSLLAMGKVEIQREQTEKEIVNVKKNVLIYLFFCMK